MQHDNLNKLLSNKSICEILDGDTALGTYNSIELKMPYLSGPDICDITEQFGKPVKYGWNGGALSRWQYMEQLVVFCIEKDKLSLLLSFLFSKAQFQKVLSGYEYDETDKIYSKIIECAIENINGVLYFGGNQLFISGNQYYVRPIGGKLEIAAPKIKTVNRDYITNIAKRANEDVDQGNFDSAITKSRTLLEEVFCYVIEEKGDTPSDSGDIGKLYRQVKDLYNMHTDPNMDKRFNKLLSGLETVLQSITEMRNKDSDAHGVGSKRVSIRDYHARLLVNSAVTMADFVLSVANYANNPT